MSFLLDTDVCSAYLKGHPAIFNRFLQHTGGLALSVISLGELCTWAARGGPHTARMRGIEDMLAVVRVLDVTPDVARTFGIVRGGLLDQGKSIASADAFIASTAIVYNLTLVTHNQKHFAPLGGLRLQDWLAP